MSNNWDNILAELKTYNNWCVSSEESKRPLNPRTLKPASVTDRHTWGSFEDAITSGMPHIGFVLTEDDPYVIIDFDDPYSKYDKDGARVYTDDKCATIIARQQQIRVKCNTYEELSKSGRGLHLIGYGKIPSGSRRDEIEVYSDNRYMICTGNTVENRPVADIQSVIDALYNEIGNLEAHETLLVEKSEEITDGELMRRASESASNAAKFRDLWDGDWCTMGYPSQSEADYALISILAFYTKSNEQVRRLFRKSGLGNRDKAVNNNKYIDTCLQGIRGKQAAKEATLAKVDISGFLATKDVPDPPEEPDVPDPPLAPLDYPPGLMGEVADYMFNSNIRPVKEVAIAASLGLFSGLTGRQYNTNTRTGLNQYIVLIAKTGVGKEGLSNGINQLLYHVQDEVPGVEAYLGPGLFASGQALKRVLDRKPCFVSVIGEIGIMLQQLCDKRANGADKALKRMLLDIYNKSGKVGRLDPTAYSDSAKDTEIVQSPSLTIVGEATPESFFESLDNNAIAEGFVSRFTLIEYRGQRPYINENPVTVPDSKMLRRVSDLIKNVIRMQQSNQVCTVENSTGAEKALKDYGKFVDDKINASGKNLEIEVWNRAHLKALRFASTAAVCANPLNPIVSKEQADWAINLINRDMLVIGDRVNNHAIGDGEARQESEIKRIIKEYYKATYSARIRYVPKGAAKADVVHANYLRKRAKGISCFKKDRRGEITAFKLRLDDMVQSAILVKVPIEQARDKYGVEGSLTADFYAPGPNF